MTPTHTAQPAALIHARLILLIALSVVLRTIVAPLPYEHTSPLAHVQRLDGIIGIFQTT
jgi:hypothetical protein